MSILQIAVRIAETAPETMRSPGVDTTINDVDVDWQDEPMTQLSPESETEESPDSDWKAVSDYIGVLKETIGKLEKELPS